MFRKEEEYVWQQLRAIAHASSVVKVKYFCYGSEYEGPHTFLGKYCCSCPPYPQFSTKSSEIGKLSER